MPQSFVNSLMIVILGSIIAFMSTWFWRFRTTTVKRLEDEKLAAVGRAEKLATEQQKLADLVATLQTQLGLVNQVVTPLNALMQQALIKQLTHLHTPELDALMAKLEPTNTLTPDDEQRMAVLLKERAEELGDTISRSERHAAIMLPFIIERVKDEAEALRAGTPQLQIVAVLDKDATNDTDDKGEDLP